MHKRAPTRWSGYETIVQNVGVCFAHLTYEVTLMVDA